MPYVTKEQIAQAKQMGLLSYLQTYDPQELVHVRGDVYSTRTHDSLKISNGKWCWWSHHIGGKSALDYLVKVEGMIFTEAVERLCGIRCIPEKIKSHTIRRKRFKLPKANDDNDRVMEYLTERGIDAQILSNCIGTKRLYQLAKNIITLCL